MGGCKCSSKINIITFKNRGLAGTVFWIKHSNPQRRNVFLTNIYFLDHRYCLLFL